MPAKIILRLQYRHGVSRGTVLAVILLISINAVAADRGGGIRDHSDTHHMCPPPPSHDPDYYYNQRITQRSDGVRYVSQGGYHADRYGLREPALYEPQELPSAPNWLVLVIIFLFAWGLFRFRNYYMKVSKHKRTSQRKLERQQHQSHPHTTRSGHTTMPSRSTPFAYRTPHHLKPPRTAHHPSPLNPQYRVADDSPGEETTESMDPGTDRHFRRRGHLRDHELHYDPLRSSSISQVRMDRRRSLASSAPVDQAQRGVHHQSEGWAGEGGLMPPARNSRRRRTSRQRSPPPTISIASSADHLESDHEDFSVSTLNSTQWDESAPHVVYQTDMRDIRTADYTTSVVAEESYSVEHNDARGAQKVSDNVPTFVIEEAPGRTELQEPLEPASASNEYDPALLATEEYRHSPEPEDSTPPTQAPPASGTAPGGRFSLSVMLNKIVGKDSGSTEDGKPTKSSKKLKKGESKAKGDKKKVDGSAVPAAEATRISFESQEENNGQPSSTAVFKTRERTKSRSWFRSSSTAEIVPAVDEKASKVTPESAQSDDAHTEQPSSKKKPFLSSVSNAVGPMTSASPTSPPPLPTPPLTTSRKRFWNLRSSSTVAASGHEDDNTILKQLAEDDRPIPTPPQPEAKSTKIKKLSISLLKLDSLNSSSELPSTPTINSPTTPPLSTANPGISKFWSRGNTSSSATNLVELAAAAAEAEEKKPPSVHEEKTTSKLASMKFWARKSSAPSANLGLSVAAATGGGGTGGGSSSLSDSNADATLSGRESSQFDSISRPSAKLSFEERRRSLAVSPSEELVVKSGIFRTKSSKNVATTVKDGALEPVTASASSRFWSLRTSKNSASGTQREPKETESDKKAGADHSSAASSEPTPPASSSTALSWLKSWKRESHSKEAASTSTISADAEERRSQTSGADHDKDSQSKRTSTSGISQPTRNSVDEKRSIELEIKVGGGAGGSMGRSLQPLPFEGRGLQSTTETQQQPQGQYHPQQEPHTHYQNHPHHHRRDPDLENASRLQLKPPAQRQPHNQHHHQYQRGYDYEYDSRYQQQRPPPMHRGNHPVNVDRRKTEELSATQVHYRQRQHSQRRSQQPFRPNYQSHPSPPERRNGGRVPHYPETSQLYDRSGYGSESSYTNPRHASHHNPSPTPSGHSYKQPRYYSVQRRLLHPNPMARQPRRGSKRPESQHSQQLDYRSFSTFFPDDNGGSDQVEVDYSDFDDEVANQQCNSDHSYGIYDPYHQSPPTSPSIYSNQSWEDLSVEPDHRGFYDHRWTPPNYNSPGSSHLRNREPSPSIQSLDMRSSRHALSPPGSPLLASTYVPSVSQTHNFEGSHISRPSSAQQTSYTQPPISSPLPHSFHKSLLHSPSNASFKTASSGGFGGSFAANAANDSTLYSPFFSGLELPMTQQSSTPPSSPVISARGQNRPSPTFHRSAPSSISSRRPSAQSGRAHLGQGDSHTSLAKALFVSLKEQGRSVSEPLTYASSLVSLDEPELEESKVATEVQNNIEDKLQPVSAASLSEGTALSEGHEEGGEGFSLFQNLIPGSFPSKAGSEVKDEESSNIAS
ncbi:hypothetical protein HDV05_008093 [Chytridiales sp. JEL 0842]|nr:hypothetical protein HDV05_008093 [Chytridiales sp. JEL 0842]